MEEIDRLRQRLVRKASKMVLGGEPSSNPFASWFGRVRVALPQENWPLDEGLPMIPLCQINCAELPYRPESLNNVALLAVFVAPDGMPSFGTPNGEGWLLRAYTDLSTLVEIQEPSDCRLIRMAEDEWGEGDEVESEQEEIEALPVRWELVDDYPCWVNFMYEASDELIEQLEANDEFDPLGHQHYSKVGGWPSLIQHRLDWRRVGGGSRTRYVFQIDSELEANWRWGDVGVGYFGRGTEANEDEWLLYWDSH